jgi:hypothetical protein
MMVIKHLRLVDKAGKSFYFHASEAGRRAFVIAFGTADRLEKAGEPAARFGTISLLAIHPSFARPDVYVWGDNEMQNGNECNELTTAPPLRHLRELGALVVPEGRKVTKVREIMIV